MLLKLRNFCPPADSDTLMQFRSDAHRAWLEAPAHQNEWLNEYKLISDLLDLACTGPVVLDR